MTAIVREVAIGNCRLILGDCRRVLPAVGVVDAIVTDPPYGIGAAAGMGGGGTDATGRWKRKPRTYTGRWDEERPDAEVFELLLRGAPQHIIWGGNFFADLLPRTGKWLFWDKMNAMPSYSDGEIAWTSLEGSSVKQFTRCNNGPSSNRDGPRVHPTQKPVDLMRWCLGFIPNAQLVLDPFMGSGSTAVACVREGRSFIGVEIDPTFFEAACTRVREALVQPDMFAAQTSGAAVQRPLFGEDAG